VLSKPFLDFDLGPVLLLDNAGKTGSTSPSAKLAARTGRQTNFTPQLRSEQATSRNTTTCENDRPSFKRGFIYLGNLN